MKKIILILTVVSVFISSCSKDDNKPKQTRLKTYTHDYYTRTPASVVERYAAGWSNNYKITWTGNKITRYGDTQLTYNSEGLIDKKIYADGSYFRNEYKGDSVLLYYKEVSVPEKISGRYKLSSTIKNPFLISGFEAEAFVTGILFYYNNASNALLPNIETAQIAYINGNLWYSRDYTFEGDFNGYPLKRNDLTNTLDGNKSKEIFTYEEF